MNIAALLSGAGAVTKSVAAHPITKGGALAALITGGLTIASVAGIAIPPVAFTIGPMAGYLLYRVLPKQYETDIDDLAQKIIDIDSDIPNLPDIHTYQEYPNEPGQNAQPPATTNITLGSEDGKAATIQSGQ